MGKSGQQRKRRRLESQIQSLAALPSPSDSDHEQDSSLPHHKSAINNVDLQTTLRVLHTLSTTPTLLQGPHMRPLRTALHALGVNITSASGSTSMSNTNPTVQVSLHLRNGAWAPALRSLDEIQRKGSEVKLGSLQRWVRDCDAHAQDDEGVYTVIDKILRVVNAQEGKRGVGWDKEEEELGRLRGVNVVRHPPWVYHPTPSTNTNAESLDTALDLTNFVIVSNTPGPARLPPNLHPAILYASHPDTIPLTPIPSRQPVTAHAVPNLPGCTLLEGVLSPRECEMIVGAAEGIGMLPDQPAPLPDTATTIAPNIDTGVGALMLGGTASTSGSILAHNFFWIADDVFISGLFERMKGCLPDRVNGGLLRGINRRFRVYRYVPGAVYRPHIDGAWPPSGLTPNTDPDAEYKYTYTFDSSPPGKPQYSRFTLLIYLNSSASPTPTPSLSTLHPISTPSHQTPTPTFTEGPTTFYTPSPTPGILDAWPVTPLQGAALVFPHGDTRGSLVHEGSGVGSGVKYVIRTDVVYDV